MGKLDNILSGSAEAFEAALEAGTQVYIDDELVLTSGERVPYRMVLLDKAAEMAARIAADHAMAGEHGLTKNESTADYYDERQMVHILAEAVRDREDPTRPLATPAALMKLREIELVQLSGRYEDLQMSADPRDHELSPAEIAWCDELIKKNSSPAVCAQLFRSIGMNKLATYATITANRLFRCQQDKSSATGASASSLQSSERRRARNKRKAQKKRQ